MLAEAVEFLRCPVCEQGLASEAGALHCPAGHSFDVARQGYATLTRGRAEGDTAAMVAARERVLTGGHFDPLAGALAEECEEAIGSRPGAIAELGAGTGWYLARVLDRLPGRIGLALDASKPALRRAARAHPRVAAVGADVWGALPLRDRSAALVLSVFAPRNGAETARILVEGGALVVATPGPDHLADLVGALELLRVDDRKEARLADQFEPHLRLRHERAVSWPLELARDDAEALAAMGPSAFHISGAELRERVADLREPVWAMASVRLTVYAA